MTQTPRRNARSVSTTWEWKKVKIAPPAASHERDGAAGLKFWHLSRWNGRKTLTVKIKYRGGSECFYWVQSRGCEMVFPGHMSLHDVMDTVYGGERRSG